MNKKYVMHNPVTGNTNAVEERDKFYISYNPCVSTGFSGDGQEETAIVTNDRKYFILIGDWRKEYENKSLDECIEVFKANIKHISEWSSQL